MSETQTGLNVGIVTTADLKGTTDAQAGIRAVNQLEGESGRVATETAAKTTAATDRSVAAKNRLKDSIRGAALQFPILGRLAEAAINPMIAGIGLAVVFAAQLHKNFKLIRTGLEDVFKADISKTLELQSQKMQAAAEDAAIYAAQLRELANAELSASKAAQAREAAVQKRGKLTEGVDEATKAVELARINEGERTGALSPERAEQMRNAVELKYSELRIKRQDEEAQTVIRIKKQELADLIAEYEKGEKKMAKLEGDLSGMDSPEQLAFQLKEKTTARDALAPTLKKQKDWAAKFRDLRPDEPMVVQIRENEAKMAELEATIADLESRLPQSRADWAGKTSALGGLRQEQFARRSRIEGLPGEIQDMQSWSNTESTTRHQIFGLQKQAMALGGGQGAGFSPAQSMWAEDQVQQGLAAGAGGPNSKLDDVAQQLAGNEIEESAAQLEAVADAINRLLGVVGRALNGDDIKRRVEVLEQQLKNNR